MSGGGGGIIIRSAAKVALADPMVYGVLPHWLQQSITQALSKDVGDWNDADCHHIGVAMHYGMTHCH